MPVRWSTLKVSQAANLIEEHVNNASAPLELAREETKKALLIPNLPEYMKSRLYAIDGEFEHAMHRFKSKIEYLRNDIPKDQLVKEQKLKEAGETPALLTAAE